MTAQLPDKVLYEGEEYVTFDEPLSSLGELPEFMDLSTGNIKGYFSVWAFVADYSICLRIEVVHQQVVPLLHGHL